MGLHTHIGYLLTCLRTGALARLGLASMFRDLDVVG